MKRTLLALAFAGLLSAGVEAQAQVPVLPYTTPAGSPNAGPVTATNPLPTSCISGCSAAGGTGANNADAVAGVGTGLGLVQSYPYMWNGATFDRQRGDTTAGLWVNCKSGCSAGTASNASDALATSSTNAGSLAFFYLYNGTTFDRARGDTTSGLWVNCKSGCAGGTSSNAADAVATSSTNGQGLSFGYVYNGTTWDRLRGDTTNGAFVNVKTSVLPTGAATSANQATAQTSLSSIVTNTTGAATAANQTTANTSLATIASNTGGAIPAGSNIIGNVRIDQTTAGTTNGVVVNSSALPTGAATAANQSTEITSLATLVTNSSAAIPAGTNVIGKVTIDTTTPGTTNLVQDASDGTTGAAVPTKATLSGARSGANIVEIIQADKSTPVTTAAASTTIVVPLSGSTKTYITSYDLVATGATSVTLISGTGATCGTGTVNLTGAYALTATGQLSRGSGLGPILVVGAGLNVCMINSAAIQVSGSIAYTQF